jgi:hypothetical protein
MRKSHFFDEFLVLLGPIASRIFACSNEKKKLTKTTKVAHSSPISMDFSGKAGIYLKLVRDKLFLTISPISWSAFSFARVLS